jgi:hypothetical protein
MKKHWLILSGLILSLSIITFGSASYEKTLTNQSTKNNTIIQIQKDKTNNVIESPSKSSGSDLSKKSDLSIKSTTKKDNDKNIQSQTTNQNDKNTIQTPTEPLATTVQTVAPIEQPVTQTTPQPPVLTPLSPTQNQETNNNVDQKIVNLSIESIGNYKVDWSNGDSAWDIMKKASAKYHFDMTYKIYPFGIYVMMIGDKKSEGNYYWSLYYNGSYSMLGASDLKVQANDEISWKYETFSW